jgi:3-phenylpropionate/trans-cinnamate dioxygenase ferredoxin subunit
MCRVICPRHGSAFDLETGIPLSLPAYEKVATYPVTVEDGIVQVEVLDATTG